MDAAKRFDAVILDIDGTLWDSREVVAQAWAPVVLQACPGKVMPDKNFLTRLFGLQMDEIASALFPDMAVAERNSWMKRCIDAEHVHLKSHPGVVYSGIRETCASLRESGFSLFIASNCEEGYPELAMQACGITEFISDYLCFGQTGLPKSGTIKKLIERNSIAKALYVGDTAKDEAACREASVPFVHAKYGFGTAENPFATISSFPEILSVVGLER